MRRTGKGSSLRLLLTGFLCLISLAGCGGGGGGDESLNTSEIKSYESVTSNDGTASFTLDNGIAVTLKTIDQQTGEAIQGVQAILVTDGTNGVYLLQDQSDIYAPRIVNAVSDSGSAISKPTGIRPFLLSDIIEVGLILYSNLTDQPAPLTADTIPSGFSEYILNEYGAFLYRTKVGELCDLWEEAGWQVVDYIGDPILFYLFPPSAFIELGNAVLTGFELHATWDECWWQTYYRTLGYSDNAEVDIYSLNSLAPTNGFFRVVVPREPLPTVSNTATISGHVYHTQGWPLSGVEMTLFPTGNKTFTDNFGYYSFSNTPVPNNPTVYTITADEQEFERGTVEDIQVYANTTVTVDLFLIPINTGTPPLTPTGISAVAGNGQVTVSWNAVSGVTSYNLYMASASGVTKTNYSTLPDGMKHTGVTSPYLHTGLTNGKTYYFVVTAVNSYGESSESSQASASPQATGTALSAPTGVNAVAGDGQVTISWNAVSGATSYNLYMASVSGVTKSNYNTLPDGMKHTGVTSPYLHTGLTNGKTYYFVVTAVNAYGESVESSEVSATPISNSPSTWIKTFGGSLYDSGSSVQQTADGGYIVAGTTNSYGAGGLDVYLIRIDANGNKLWDKTFGGTLDDDGWEVQQTADGGFIVVGDTKSYGAGSEDVYLVKTDANGNKVWDKTFGGPNRDFGVSVKQTTDGGYIISGVYGYSADDYDVYLIRTDADGNKLWEQIFGGASDDGGLSVQQTIDGGFIIAGGKDATYTFDDIYYVTVYGGDVYLIKTDSYGNKVWEKTDGSWSLGEIGNSVRQISDGGYIVTGWKESFSSSFDTYLVKFDSYGNKLWGNIFGGSDIDYGDSVQQTSDGGYIISGLTSSYGAGGGDVYLIKTDSSGSKQWEKTFGGASGERGLEVQQTSEGGYIITGYTESSGAGGSDIYLIKTDSTGNAGAPIAIASQAKPSTFKTHGVGRSFGIRPLPK